MAAAARVGDQNSKMAAYALEPGADMSPDGTQSSRWLSVRE
jgi:hypothetical protein